jgi:hypothetical protein
MASVTAAELYRREAARLRAMADIPTFREVRDSYLEIADRYDDLARQADTAIATQPPPTPYHASWRTGEGF